MRQRAFAILTFAAAVWLLPCLCAMAGLSSRVPLAQTRPVSMQTGVAYDSSADVRADSGFPHGWASQPWHTGLLQESEPSETVEEPEASAEELPSDPTPGERIEFDSYLSDPQEAARKGLAGSSAPPWYSAEEDRAVPIGIKAGDEPYPDGVEPGNRASDWEATPAANTTTTPAGGNTGPLVELPLTQIVWVGLVLGFILLAGLLLFALLRGQMNQGDKSQAESPLDEEEDPIAVQERIERLPFELRHGVVDFLDEAQRLASSGKYEEALVYLFSHALVQLDRANRIRLAKGKTNRQYVGEIASSPPLAGLLGELADEFERVFFGKYRLSQAKYEESLGRIERFRHLLQQTSDA